MLAGMNFKFSRNQQNEVISYSVNAGRVKNIGFSKLK